MMEIYGTSIVKSAGRVFEILEHFDEVKAPLSLKAVAARFGCPTSSAFGLLKSMVALGYLTYDRTTRTYLPTTRLALLGSWVLGTLSGDGRALELMDLLHRTTAETILLAARSDLWVQYVHVIQSSLPVRYCVVPGTHRPLLGSGAGWMLLAQQDDDEARRVVARLGAQRHRAMERITEEEALRRLAEVRRAGYMFSKGAVQPGVGAIVRPLPPGPDGERLVVGVAGPIERLEAAEKRIHAAMRSAIARYKADTVRRPERRLER